MNPKKALIKAEDSTSYRIRPGESIPTTATFSTDMPAEVNILAKLPKERGSLRCIFREGNVKINVSKNDTVINSFELKPNNMAETKLALTPDDMLTILVDNNGQYSTCDEMFVEFETK